MSSNSKNTKKFVRPTRNVLIGIAILILLILFGLWGVHRVANGSTPKDILYPVDRGFEQIRRAVTFSPISRANLALDSFNERQHEAQNLVLVSDYNVCDTRNSASNSGNDEAVLVALNAAQEDLAQAEAEILQVNNGSAKEELNARLVEVVGHHLLIWETISKFVPTQSISSLKQSTDIMAKAIDRAYNALPEGRRNDLTAQLKFNLPAVVASINSKLGICEEDEAAKEDAMNSAENGGNGAGTSGSNGGSSNTTNNNGSVRPLPGTPGAAGQPGRPGTAGTPGGSGTGGNNGAGGNGLNVNVNSDAGINVDAGINEQGQLYLEPTIAPVTDNGVDSEVNVNDSNVVNTDACPGPQILGVCL